MRGTSNKGLEGILSVEPLHLFLEGIAIKTRIRTSDEVPLTWDGNSQYHYRRSANETQKKKKIGHLKELDCKVREIFGNNLLKDRTKKKKNKFKVKLNLIGKITYCEDSINIYTDGSKTKNGSGTGVAIYENKELIHTESHRLNNEAIVYQAELFGIFRANNWIHNTNNISKKYAVFVDNISALKVMNANVSNSKTVQVIWDSNENVKNFDVTYYWIKGHNKNFGNDKADELAKKGTTEPNIIDLPLTKSAIDEKIKSFKEKNGR